ncbi:predicted protein [Brucella sp. 83/13]|nr:predicted protein [Brucella sp. 83/13]
MVLQTGKQYCGRVSACGGTYVLADVMRPRRDAALCPSIHTPEDGMMQWIYWIEFAMIVAMVAVVFGLTWMETLRK